VSLRILALRPCGAESGQDSPNAPQGKEIRYERHNGTSATRTDTNRRHPTSETKNANDGAQRHPGASSGRAASVCANGAHEPGIPNRTGRANRILVELGHARSQPLEGSYTGGPKCDGNFVGGVFFLGGAASITGAPSSVERTCTVRAKKPILFPVTNVVCSKAFGVAGQDPPDPKPYDTACATPYTDDVINPPSSFYARVDGKDAKQLRIASGIFRWTIASNDNPYGLIAGTYPAASDGLWVYLRNGLHEGTHTVKFGGHYEVTPFGTFEGTKVTYHLKARR
jgi:hypothetical protein